MCFSERCCLLYAWEAVMGATELVSGSPLGSELVVSLSPQCERTKKGSGHTDGAPPPPTQSLSVCLGMLASARAHLLISEAASVAQRDSSCLLQKRPRFHSEHGSLDSLGGCTSWRNGGLCHPPDPMSPWRLTLGKASAGLVAVLTGGRGVRQGRP